MTSVTSADGRYICYDQGDGNFVVYLADTMTPVWDRWGYEALNPEPQSLIPTPSTSADGSTIPSATAPPPVALPSSPTGVGRVIPVTNPSDGRFVNRGYSYWSQVWIDPSGVTAYVFAGHEDGQPRFFAVGLSTRSVTRLGSLIPYAGTTEGWYWDRDGWIYLLEGPRLRHVNPFTLEDVVVFDISDTHPGCRLWQAHSSDDGQTHSATVQRIVSDGAYPNLGTVVCRAGSQTYFEAHGALDESQITSDGAFLVIKEDDDNRIIELATRETRLLKDADGAVGHSDCGAGFLVGEDNIHGACVRWDLRNPLTPERRKELFKTWNMGHVAIKADRCVVSDADAIYVLPLDGPHAGWLNRIINHGMVGEGYDCQVMANLDPTGRVACYLTNRGTDRLDVCLLLL